jgi:pyridoxamine--pyruvate transaminase
LRYQDHETPVFWLTSGPVDIYPEVREALGRPVLYEHDPVFRARYARVTERLRVALRTTNDPVILQGEPVLGLEAAAASLIARDDVVLNLVSGVFGDGFGWWARRYCDEVLEIRVPYNAAIDPAAVAQLLQARPDITVVALCHHDTPSGTINPVAEIGRIVASHGAFLLVDAVSSFGGMDVHPDDCGADIFVTAPQKCLGCPPGLTIMSVSERAWAKMKANPRAPRASFLSILDWEGASRVDRPFPFTPSVAEINALEAAVERYLSEGPARVWARHALTARACRAGVKALGLKLWADDESIASPTTTAVAVPAGIDAAALLQAAQSRCGVMLSAGSGATEGKLLRVGHMGPTAHPVFAVVAITALGAALHAVGVPADVGAAVNAAMQVIDAAADLPQ